MVTLYTLSFPNATVPGNVPGNGIFVSRQSNRNRVDLDLRAARKRRDLDAAPRRLRAGIKFRADRVDRGELVHVREIHRGLQEPVEVRIRRRRSARRWHQLPDTVRESPSRPCPVPRSRPDRHTADDGIGKRLGLSRKPLHRLFSAFRRSIMSLVDRSLLYHIKKMRWSWPVGARCNEIFMHWQHCVTTAPSPSGHISQCSTERAPSLHVHVRTYMCLFEISNEIDDARIKVPLHPWPVGGTNKNLETRETRISPHGPPLSAGRHRRLEG